MTCPRCAADPQPENFGSPRRCAFETGTFNPNNWQCETMALLSRSVAHCFHEDDENLLAGCVDFGEFFGILVLQQYKQRGCIAGAIIFNTTQGGHRELTLELAEKYLEET